VTEADCAARHGEVLRDATQRETRLTIGAYELVRRSRPGQSAAAWSYQMIRVYYKAWRAGVIRSARGDPE